MPNPLRIAILGTAKRSSYLYGPLVKAMPGVELVGVWGRSQDSVDKLASELNVPAFTDLSKLKSDLSPDIGIVSVSYGANGKTGLLAVQHGFNVLLETPIAHDLAEADAIIAEASKQRVKVEVAEQFHRRPMEQIKLKLIESGLFGRVYTSFNDFAGHGYHGVSVMRSYLGFDARPVRVTGAVRSYDLAPYYSRTQEKFGPQTEEQEHGIVEFDDGRLGIYHWTSVGYDSPLRWWRSSRFLAERGMGVTTGVYPDLDEHITLLAPGDQGVHKVTIERQYERVDGGGLRAVVAHTGDIRIPTVTWKNPFASGIQGHNPQWHDDEIGVAGCLQSLVDAVRTDSQPTYGAQQARLDQEITLAIRRSSEFGGAPVELLLSD
jgi:predicted dehydrogenase